MHIACDKGYLGVVQCILQQSIVHHLDCNLFATTITTTTSSGMKDGWMALHLASMKGYLEIVQVLVEYQSNIVDAVTAHTGCTALCLAIQHNHFPIIHYLIVQGEADVNAINHVRLYLII